MTTLIAHLGTQPHLHAIDMLVAVVLAYILYSVALYVRRPKRVSAERFAALREYVHALSKKRGSK